MPTANEQDQAARANNWSTADFAFALRELREEFPLHSVEAITGVIRVAEQKLPPVSGRARLVQVTREQIRAR